MSIADQLVGKTIKSVEMLGYNNLVKSVLFTDGTRLKLNADGDIAGLRSLEKVKPGCGCGECDTRKQDK